jgi:hypothetical protein
MATALGFLASGTILLAPGGHIIAENTKTAKRFRIAPEKYDYFFRRVGGKNAARSQQIQRVLKELGIEDTPSGREALERIFEQGLDGEEMWRGTNDYGVTIRRAVDVGGKRLTIAYFYESGDLETIPKVTTIIPKE